MCCLHLKSCNGLVITTIEGLGNTKDGLHPIQVRLTKYDGAQCGFCSPSQVINMYSLLKTNGHPNMKEIEDSFDTTLCRCEGYRSILDSMKSFAVDAHTSLQGGPIDIEDIPVKLCKTSGQACSGKCSRKGRQSCTDGEKKDNSRWLTPASLDELCVLLEQHRNKKYKLVYGNTAFGVHRDLHSSNYETLIDTRQVKQLNKVELNHPDRITIGANLTLISLRTLFEQNKDQGVSCAEVFAKHLRRVASTGVRNIGCWVGNLMLKYAKQDFPSDIFLLLETVDAKPEIAFSNGQVLLRTLKEFIDMDMKGHVIVSMQLPKYKPGQYIVRTLRTAHRYQHCLAHIVSGFRFEIDQKNEYLILSKPSIVVQGLSSEAFHAERTEKYLEKKKLSYPLVVKEAMSILSQDVENCTNGPLFATKEYRQRLVLSHFYKFLLDVCSSLVSTRYASGAREVDRPVMSGTQDYGIVDSSRAPANQPMMKVTAKNLMSSLTPPARIFAREIKFLDDQPNLPDQLYAAVVLSGQGNAKIKSIDTSKALVIPGVVKFLQASDIPGENNWRVKSWYGGQVSELLSSGAVDYAGQPIGIVVADDPKTALMGAHSVNVTYTDVKPVILDVMEAITAQSFHPKLGTFTKGDPQTAMVSSPHSVKGNTRSGEQFHFHLENQTAVCAPTDTGGIDVQATSQWIDFTQEVVSQVLGISGCNCWRNSSSPGFVPTLCFEEGGGGSSVREWPYWMVCSPCAIHN